MSLNILYRSVCVPIKDDIKFWDSCAGARGRPAAAQGVYLLSRIYSQFYFMQNRPKIVENISRGWAPDRLTLPISGRAPPSV